MDLAWLSLGALVLAMIISCFSQLNVGVLGLALAWILGVYLGGMKLAEVMNGFPTQTFLMLVGVTLLFTQAQLNGDRKSTRLNSSHSQISYAVFCLKKKKKTNIKYYIE